MKPKKPPKPKPLKTPQVAMTQEIYESAHLAGKKMGLKWSDWIRMVVIERLKQESENEQ